MGFDFYIKLRLNLCEQTGKPCYHEYKDGKYITHYDINSITVPEQYRRFLTLCGHVFHLYVMDLENGDDHFTADISEILEVFPSWEDIESSSLSKKYELTEEDHNAFHEALKWFDEQKCGFYATWSY